MDVVTYAVDLYVMFCGNNANDIKPKAETTMQKHFEFLESIGMVVDRSISEVTCFNNKVIPLELSVVEGSTITLSPKL